MPGFFIGKSGVGGANSRGPDANIETHRDNRFAILNFMSLTPYPDSPFIYIKDITMPNKVIKTLPINTISTTYNFASHANYSDMKMSFYTSSKNFIDEIIKLENKVHTVDDGVKDFNTYKSVIEILWFKDGGGYDSSATKVKFTCKGCVISNVSWNQVSYGSSAIKVVDLTVKVDVLEIDPESSLGGS